MPLQAVHSYWCSVFYVQRCCFAGHLPQEHRRRFKQLEEHEELLAGEMKRDVITQYLRHHDLLTVHQYQRVTDFRVHYDANKYLLQLIRSEPPEYLAGMKEALVKAKQPELIDFLP